MTITADPSVFVSVILNEPTKPALVKATEGAELQAPPSIPWEVANALSALVRRNRITPDQARSALSEYQSIPVRLAEIDLEAALTLAAKYRIYAYDAFVIDCAKRYRTPLLSLDRRQVGIAEQEGVEIIPILP